MFIKNLPSLVQARKVKIIIFKLLEYILHTYIQVSLLRIIFVPFLHCGAMFDSILQPFLTLAVCILLVLYPCSYLSQ